MSKYVRQQKSLPKHPKACSATSLIAAPFVPENPRERPGLKGPGFTSKKGKYAPRPVAPAKPVVEENLQEQHLSIEDQQLVLNVVRGAFPKCSDYDILRPVLEVVRKAVEQGGAEAQRVFEGEAGKAAREAWMVRWGAGRALCFAAVVIEVCEKFGGEAWVKGVVGEDGVVEGGKGSGTVRVLSFGAGSTEVLALGAMLRHLRADAIGASAVADTPDLPSTSEPIIDHHIVNPISWGPEIHGLHTSLTTPLPISKYASATAIANNAPFLAPSVMVPSVHELSILQASQDELSALLGAEPGLITLFHSLADLAVTSVAKTAAFLLKLTIAAPKGSLLLVVDRAEGVEASKGEEGDEGVQKRRYPLRYVLDMALMGKGAKAASKADESEEEVNKAAWKMLVADEERMFKIDDGLKHAMGLENLKVQVFLFRRL